MPIRLAWLAWRLVALGPGCVVVRPPDLGERPRWQVIAGDHYDAGCISARAFVRKSGKQGLGIALQLRSRGDCNFAIASGRVALDGHTVDVPGLPTIDLHGRSQLYAWLPVRFDGDAAWNAGRVDATLELAIALDGVPAPAWRLALHDAMEVAP